MIYIAIDKVSKEPLGFVDILPEHLSSHEKDFVMVDGDESYRGKSDYEIKYELGVVRHATQQEIDIYIQNQKDIEEQTKIDSFLQKLNDDVIIQKIKNLKRVVA